MDEKVKAGDLQIRDVRRSSSLSAQLYTVGMRANEHTGHAFGGGQGDCMLNASSSEGGSAASDRREDAGKVRGNGSVGAWGA